MAALFLSASFCMLSISELSFPAAAIFALDSSSILDNSFCEDMLLNSNKPFDNWTASSIALALTSATSSVADNSAALISLILSISFLESSSPCLESLAACASRSAFKDFLNVATSVLLNFNLVAFSARISATLASSLIASITSCCVLAASAFCSNLIANASSATCNCFSDNSFWRSTAFCAASNLSSSVLVTSAAMVLYSAISCLYSAAVTWRRAVAFCKSKYLPANSFAASAAANVAGANSWTVSTIAVTTIPTGVSSFINVPTDAPASSKAPLKSPSNSFFNAELNKPTTSKTASILSCTKSSINCPKSLTACCGSSNASIKVSANPVTISRTTSKAAPKNAELSAKNFCPFSERCKALNSVPRVTAIAAITAPTGFATSANIWVPKALNPVAAAPNGPGKAAIEVPSPPVAVLAALASFAFVFNSLLVFFSACEFLAAAFPVSLNALFKSFVSFSTWSIDLAELESPLFISVISFFAFVSSMTYLILTSFSTSAMSNCFFLERNLSQ